MRHELVIIRTNDEQVSIEVSLEVDFLKAYWGTPNVRIKRKGKRKFEYVPNHKDIVTQEEIWEAKIQLWNKLKPSL